MLTILALKKSKLELRNGVHLLSGAARLGGPWGVSPRLCFCKAWGTRSPQLLGPGFSWAHSAPLEVIPRLQTLRACVCVFAHIQGEKEKSSDLGTKRWGCPVPSRNNIAKGGPGLLSCLQHQRQPLWLHQGLDVCQADPGMAGPREAVNVALSKGTSLHIKEILSKI